MDERDPDVTVPLASLDQRYLGEESFGRDEVHSEHRQRAWTCHITNGVPPVATTPLARPHPNATPKQPPHPRPIRHNADTSADLTLPWPTASNMVEPAAGEGPQPLDAA